jgi:hypothetical protein
MAQIFASTSEHSGSSDFDVLQRPGRPITDAELLHHYTEQERIIRGGQRTLRAMLWSAFARTDALAAVIGSQLQFARPTRGPSHR